jgi:hypothetical protein
MIELASYVVSLAKRERETIGFIPGERYLQAYEAGQLVGQRFNGELCGFLYHGPIRADRAVHIWQCAIQVDARRLNAATEVVAAFVARCERRQAACIRLRCAAELEANAFWVAMGFTPVRVVAGGLSRGRLIIEYCRNLYRPGLLF